MQLSETIKLYLTREQKAFIVGMMKEYPDVINRLVSLHLSGTSILKLSTKDFDSGLPSNSEGCAIQFAKAVVKKYEKDLAKAKRRAEKKGTPVKEPTVPVFKKPFCGVHNQQFKIDGDRIRIPICDNGKVYKIPIKSSITERQKNLFEGVHLGELKLVYKGRKIVAQIPYDVEAAPPVASDVVMGVDLGVKCPAVAYISNGKVKFYGNGRMNRYIRRKYASLRMKLQRRKKLNAVKRLNNKEQRIMKNIDHHISRGIVNDAIANNVGVIKVETLDGIRDKVNKEIDERKNKETFKGKKRISKKTARKLKDMINKWSFFREINYLKYKSELAGIKLVFVNPAYTSKTCPKCGRLNEPNDRTYVCKCGFRSHRDLVGAMNICNSTEIVEEKKKRAPRKKKKDAEPELATANE